MENGGGGAKISNIWIIYTTESTQNAYFRTLALKMGRGDDIKKEDLFQAVVMADNFNGR